MCFLGYSQVGTWVGYMGHALGTVCDTLVRCVGTIHGYSVPFMRTHVPRPHIHTRSKNKSL